MHIQGYEASALAASRDPCPEHLSLICFIPAGRMTLLLEQRQQWRNTRSMAVAMPDPSHGLWSEEGV
jgi:hypothetical protein